MQLLNAAPPLLLGAAAKGPSQRPPLRPPTESMGESPAAHTAAGDSQSIAHSQRPLLKRWAPYTQGFNRPIIVDAAALHGMVGAGGKAGPSSSSHTRLVSSHPAHVAKDPAKEVRNNVLLGAWVLQSCGK